MAIAEEWFRLKRGFKIKSQEEPGLGLSGLGSGKSRSDAGKNIPGSDARSSIRGSEARCARK